MKFRKYIFEGERMPYGYGTVEYNGYSRKIEIMIMPFNWIVSGLRWLYWKMAISWFYENKFKYEKKIYDKGYRDGYAAAELKSMGEGELSHFIGRKP